MKTRVKRHGMKPGLLAFAALSMFSVVDATWAQASRKFLDSSHPLAKAVVLVAQTAHHPPGNGIVVGREGCHVLTNFHVAFGESKDPKTGRVHFVDKIRIGHNLLVNANFDSQNNRFQITVEGTVIEFGNFEQDTRRGKIEDYALLRLEPCLGMGYGITDFEINAESKRYPEGKISSIAFTELNGKLGVVMEDGCPSFLDDVAGKRVSGNPAAQAPLTGMIATRCHLPPGTSGSMLLATDNSGKTRLIGINQGGDYAADGSKVSIAVYAREFNKILASVLGNELFTSPQN